MDNDQPAKHRVQTVIRRMKPGEHVVCDRILRSLPDWFGIDQSIVEYVRDLQTMETWVAEVGGMVVGFLTINQHNESSAEIHVMAVVQKLHGKGCGRRLVEHAERVLQSRGVEFLQVKTLGPSRPNACYERSRRFYERVGFRPLEETALWGDTNPCLILVKHLLCARGTG